MDKDITLLGIMVDNFESTEQINEMLHQHRHHVMGRLGIPAVKGDLSVICVVFGAPHAEVEQLAEQLNGLHGVKATLMCE